jgi:SAM-dependent methyltransferase
MPSHLADELRGFVSTWLPEPPARILDVGCGGGESTDWLRDRGFEALGVDPEAPGGEGYERSRIQDFVADAPFDAALAMRSLHHVGGLDEAAESIARSLSPHARLVVFEFAIEAVDRRALEWCSGHGLRTPTHPGSAPEVAPLSRVREALAQRFEELVDEPAPYLARELGEPGLEGAEMDAIAAGRLAAAGARLAYERA